MKRNGFVAMIILGASFGIILHANYVEGTAPIVYASEPEPPQEVLVRAETQEERLTRKIVKAFPNEPRMVLVAKCESGFIPTAISHTNDHGLFQINKTVHDTTGYDLYDEDENIAYAKRLYNQSGLAPWKYSSHCWMK